MGGGDSRGRQLVMECVTRDGDTTIAPPPAREKKCRSKKSKSCGPVGTHLVFLLQQCQKSIEEPKGPEAPDAPEGWILEI